MRIGSHATRSSFAAALLVMAMALGACSAHFDVGRTKAVSKDQLADIVKQKLEAQVGAEADSVVCEGNLSAKVGATQRCVLTDGSKKYGVTATATSVDGDNVKFDIDVDDKPMK